MTGVPPGWGMGLTQFEVSRALPRARPRGKDRRLQGSRQGKTEAEPELSWGGGSHWETAEET